MMRASRAISGTLAMALAGGLACSRPAATEARAGIGKTGQTEEVTTMAPPATAAPPRTSVPPIDAEAPARVETATFAMG